MKFRSAVLLFSLLIAGCASAPRVQQPTLKVDLPRTWTAGVPRQAPADSLWWTGFEDARLDSLVAQAFGHNFDLQAAAARVQAAAAQAKVAGAPLYPQVGVGSTASRRKQNFIGLPIPGSEGVASSTSSSFGVSLDLSWEVDLWGRLGAGKAAALADLQAAQAVHRGAQLSLVGQTAKVWFAAVEANRQVELARATVENYRTSQEQVRSRYERGLRSSLDLRLTLADLAVAQDRLHQREGQLDGVLRQLELLLGRYPGAAIVPGSALPPVPEAVPAGLPAELVSRRPDLVAAERRLAASHARLVQARRALYPRISLTGSGGRTSNELGDLLDGNFGVWNLMGNVVQPLFQGGRIRGGIDLAESRSREALALYVGSALRAYGEVEAALAGERFLSLREEALKTAAEQALAARRLTEERYGRGLTDLVTMLSAQRSAYQSESLLLTVRRQRLEARVDLHLALGGGFSNRGEILSTLDSTPNSGVEMP